jgi:hypothetical protein
MPPRRDTEYREADSDSDISVGGGDRKIKGKSKKKPDKGKGKATEVSMRLVFCNAVIDAYRPRTPGRHRIHAPGTLCKKMRPAACRAQLRTGWPEVGAGGVISLLATQPATEFEW